VSYTFTKLFSSITESTIWVEPHPVRIVWITMLAMADKSGRVFGSIPGLANRARVTVEEAEAALQRFKSPDKYSRTYTEECEGRRVVDIDGGWRLLNHAKYRALQDEETVKESKRRWWHENKGLDKTRKSRSHSIQAEAEADTDKSKDKGTRFALPDGFPLEAWQGFEEMRKKIRKPLTDRARNLILAELKTLGGDPAALLNQSVQNSWAGVFPLKAPKSNGDGPPWWASNAGIEAKAKEINLPSRPGESYADWKARISARLT
jgi:hypothetical protein